MKTTVMLFFCAIFWNGCTRIDISEDKKKIEQLEKEVETLDRELRELKTNYFKLSLQHIEVLEAMEKRVSTVEDKQISADWMKDPKRVWLAISNLNNYISHVDAESVKKEATQK